MTASGDIMDGESDHLTLAVAVSGAATLVLAGGLAFAMARRSKA